MQHQLEQSGHFSTPHGSKYLQQLCKHFAHKVAVSHDSDQGSITFDAGSVRLRADAVGLTILLSGADDTAVGRLRGIIDSHLPRFAFREAGTTVIWSDPLA